MPKTTTIVALTHPSSGEAVAAGTEISLSNEEYAALRAAGAVEASADEQKANRNPATSQGVYNARTSRADAGGTG